MLQESKTLWELKKKRRLERLREETTQQALEADAAQAARRQGSIPSPPLVAHIDTVVAPVSESSINGHTSLCQSMDGDPIPPQEHFAPTPSSEARSEDGAPMAISLVSGSDAAELNVSLPSCCDPMHTHI